MCLCNEADRYEYFSLEISSARESMNHFRGNRVNKSRKFIPNLIVQKFTPENRSIHHRTSLKRRLENSREIPPKIGKS
jgi:hypothetical protein